ncbi:hypothetical protein QYE76_027603 [Lolium multiflorum]|uniref:Uncharacterized protein n=1 Tax=Lolium multiflorum TaxID=4521 RepID=A0AAD8QJE9_LOLMU|nr:hypothetical protein QYE76_027603 [Lolium multiflorum]
MDRRSWQQDCCAKLSTAERKGRRVAERRRRLGGAPARNGRVYRRHQREPMEYVRAGRARPGPDGDPFTGRRGPLEYDGAGRRTTGLRWRTTRKRTGEDDEEDDDEDEEGGEEEDDEGAGTMISWR